jgi:hypothetical protein
VAHPSLSINLSDPNVQAMLGQSDVHGHPASGKREVVQIAGDPMHGLRSTVNLTAGKHEVAVLYKDLIMTVDVYMVPGEPLKIHLLCPKCHKHSTIPGERKAIDFEPIATNPQWARVAEVMPGMNPLGRLSVEEFECPWEMGEDKHVRGGLHTGVTLCRQRLAIDNNRAKDA